MEGQKHMQGLLKSLRCNWQRQRRNKKQLVIIALGMNRVEVSCWQADCCLWQKGKSLAEPWLDGSEPWWQELDDVLKDVFIWARVPDMVDTILVLQQELVFREELRLPRLEEGDLLQAIEWEAEQLVPWPKGSYNTAFASQATHGLELEEEIVELWSWPKEQAARAGRIMFGLRLHLQGILVGLECDKLQRAWYQGAQFKNWSLQTERQLWQHEASSFAASGYPKLVCLLCMLLAGSIYACAKGACYLARYQLDQTRQELANYELWQKRYEQSQKLDASLKYYHELVEQMEQYKSHAGNSISRIGQQMGASCWLESLQGGLVANNKVNSKSSKQGVKQPVKSSFSWQLEGACYKHESLERLLERLEASKQLAQVQLQHSQQEQDKLKFTLSVREK